MAPGECSQERIRELGVTLFVENIPNRMQWKGLWHLFARHGKVTRTFIVRKLSRGGKRFGFVGFENNIDVERVSERLNGFSVYGYKLTVKKAYQNRRGGVRVKEGETTSVCSVKSIADRLKTWGLNGLTVHIMGGKAFLLSFEDEDIFIMLEDLQWAYLKEIFCNVVMWSKEQRTLNRATWIEVRGLPLHAWNGTSLKRIAELWSNFEAYGDNVNRRIDSEKNIDFDHDESS
ncbi:hypothetical protein GQ457_18G015810 [Hibiscus cannabinus]